MAKADVLKQIKQAEAAAEKTLSSAEEKAARILHDARREAAEIVQTASDGSLSETKATIDEARAAAGQAAGVVEAEGAEVVAAIRSEAEQRRSDAARLVLDSLVPTA